MFTREELELKGGPLDGKSIPGFPWGIAEPSVLYLMEGIGEGVFVGDDGKAPGRYVLRIDPVTDVSAYYWEVTPEGKS
jgi:hypothetical protein